MTGHTNGPDEPTAPEPAALNDLAEVLFGPNGHAEAERVRERLQQIRQSAEIELRAGASRVRFEALTALQAALESADAVMVDISRLVRP